MRPPPASTISARDPGRTLMLACRVIAGGALLLAAGAKLLEPSAFAEVVLYLTDGRLDGHLAAPALIAVETALGVGLLLGVALYAWAAVAALAIMTLALVVLLFDSGAPSCGCMGPLTPDIDARAEAGFGIVRNIGLALCAGTAARAPALRSTATGAPPARRVHAFTLVETLAVITVVGVLLTLLLPALAGAHERALRAEAAASARAVVQALLTYADDHHGAAPFLATPRRPELGFTLPGPHQPLRAGPLPYFRQDVWYLAALHGVYLDAHAVSAGVDTGLFAAPAPTDIPPARFLMTYACFAAPAFWRDDVPRGVRPAWFRPVPLHQARHPASKGLLLDTRLGPWGDDKAFEWNQRVTLATLDGAATERAYSERSDTISDPVTRPFGALPWYVLATRHGLNGRDF